MMSVALKTMDTSLRTEPARIARLRIPRDHTKEQPIAYNEVFRSGRAAANNPNFAFELVNASTGADCVSTQGTPLNNSSGNWRFHNVSINGTPVPEPASVL